MSEDILEVDLQALRAIPDDAGRLEALLGAAWGERHGHASGLRELAQEAAWLAGFLHDEPARATALAMLALAAYRDTAYDVAASLAGDALAAARIEPTDAFERWEAAMAALPALAREALAEAVTALAVSDFRLGRFPAGLLHANLEAHLRRVQGDDLGEAMAWHGVGWGYDKVGLHQHALEHHLHALAVVEPLAPDLAASPLNGIAETYLNLGNPERAREYSLRALAAAGDGPERRRERSTALRALGLAAQRQKDFAAAEAHFRDSMTASDTYGVSLNLISLGHMFLEMGRPEAALAEFQACVDALGEHAQRRTRAEALIGAGEAALVLARPGQALDALRAALDTATDTDSLVEVYRAHHGMARALRALGRAESALEHYETYHRIRDQVLREASDVRTRVLTQQFDVERLRMDREIDRLTNVELAAAYRQLKELNARLERQAVELERLSREDDLTGLSNRRALDARLDAEVIRARRDGTALALVMLDIDNFKEINDRFSHTVGDQVLRRVSDVLRGNLRAVDMCARFGGDEFVVVVPGADLAGATQVGEKLRLSVETADWDHLGRGLGPTVSVGVAALRATDDGGSLLARTDAMLYRTKRGGRNRVEH